MVRLREARHALVVLREVGQLDHTLLARGPHAEQVLHVRVEAHGAPHIHLSGAEGFVYSMSAFRWVSYRMTTWHARKAVGMSSLVRMGFMYVEYIWKSRGRLLPSRALQDLEWRCCDSSLRDLKLSQRDASRVPDSA